MTILRNIKRLFVSAFIAMFCIFSGANAGFADTYDVTYACGDGTGTAPAATTATSESTFTPATNTCTAPTDYTFAGWAVSDTDDTVSDAFTWNYDEDKTLTATYRPTYFTVTTIPLTSGDVFKFNISAAGTFNVDCGTDGVLSGDGVSGTTITRANTTQATYTCTYSSGGVKNIKFTGTATAYSTATNASGAAILFGGDTAGLTPELIASISGSVGGVFPTLGQNASQQPIFYNTFKGSSSLTSIPAGLFSGISGGANNMFQSTFQNCTSLASIPSGLFDGITTGAASMFDNTFSGCTALSAIPAGLFSNITTGANSLFEKTFKNCKALTALPENLFSGITTAHNELFEGTFEGCSNLSGYIPPNIFAGLIANGSPKHNELWRGPTFKGTKLATVCPAGTQQYITGYEGFTPGSTWNGYVSCEPSDLSCTGATFATNNQCTPCPTGYTSDTTDGKTTQSQCKISCAAGTYIAAAGDTTCTTVEVGYYIGANDFKYGEYNKRNGCGTGRTTLTTGSTSESACVCDGATYMNNGTCMDCPVGYTANTAPGKTAAEQCQIHCNAGTWLSNVGNPSCSNVGLGFYTAASDVYYGQIGTRDKCASGLITATDSSTSVNDCITSNSPCTGATYYDGSSCVACPNGYDHNTDDGKVSVHQCQISCAAGTYVKTATHAYTLLEYLENTGTSYVNTGYNHTSANIRGEIRIGSPSTGAVSGNSNFLGTQGNGAGYSFGWNKGFKMWVESAKSNITGANYTIAQGATADVAYELTGTTRKIEWPTNQHKDGTHTGLGSQSPLWLFNAKDQSDRFFKGKIYYFRLYENGELVGEWLPARRQSDNKLGMFDTVNETFVEATVRNNTMLAGPEVNSDCVAVGKGYYAPASVIDYGSIGSKFACPAGTYQGTENGTSLASCLACTGATYSDSVASAACTACPTGYNYNTTSNKTSINQCQVQCAAGTYVAPDYTELEYIEATGSQYIDTIVLANTYVNPIVTMTMEYTELTGDAGTGTEKIYIRTNNGGTKFMANAGGTEVELGDADTNKHTFVINTVNGTVSIDGTPTALTPSTLDAKEFYIGRRNGAGSQVRGKYYGINIISDGNVMFNMIPVRRESDGVVGMLNTVTNVFYPNTSVATFIAGPDTEDATGTAGCISAEAGYYAPQSSVVNYGSVSPASARIACPIGKYSSTVGATSASACQSCTGATYNDVTAATSCKACPTGYTANTTAGKDEITDCQISCAAGSWVPGLPSAYEQIEYIETTGTQYINTGIKPADLTNPVFSITAQHVEIGSARLFGSRNGSNFLNIGALGSKFGCNSGTTTQSDIMTYDTGKHNFVIDLQNASCSVDNTTVSVTVGNLSGWTAPIGLGFDMSGSGTRPKVKIYKASIQSNGETIMNLIPARRKSDNVLGMYDTVSGQFKTNAGSGTFGAGPNGNYTNQACEPVGTGHYATASVINYLDGGIRASCPIGTYSGVTNGGSASACQSCTGATYNDETGMAACKACPTGYTANTTSGKDEITDCQISCAAGTYLTPLLPTEYTRLEYIESTGTQHINTGMAIKNTVNPVISMTLQYTVAEKDKYTGASTDFKFGISGNGQFIVQAKSDGVTFGYADLDKHTFVLDTANSIATLDNTTLPITVGDWSTLGNSFFINHNGSYDSYKGRAKYYHFSLISDGVQIRNMVPAKRNSDNVVGMYDLVNDVFYGPASGTFIAGPIASGDGASCTNVGTGHWAAAATLNYNTLGTRNACPVGTYSDITTGASAAACTACAGATYNDKTGMAACKACPTGYTYNTTAGKDEISDCQIHCDAGYFLSPVPTTDYIPLEYITGTGTQYIDTGIAVNSLTNPIMSVTMKYNTVANQSSGAGQFYIGIYDSQFTAKVNGAITQLGAQDTNKHTFVVNTQNATASVDDTTLNVAVGDLSTESRTILVGQRNGSSSSTAAANYYNFSLTSGGRLVMNLVPVIRKSDDAVGMFDTITGTFYGNAGTGVFLAGTRDTNNIGNGGYCVPVGTGWWVGASTVNYGDTGATRNACPVGTYSDITTGASANDCLSCSGATYNDTPGAAACTACPTGYTYNTTAGKDEIYDCQINCAAGTYLDTLLPSEYTQLTYIESTGSQYINTGLYPGILTGSIISLTTQYTAVENSKWNGSEPTDGALGLGIDSNGQFFAEPKGPQTKVTFGAADTNKHTFVMDLANGTASLDDMVKTLDSVSVSDSGRKFCIAASCNGESATNGAFTKAKYYNFNVTVNGVAVRDMVPAKRNSDNAVGMYDLVNGVFYAGGGENPFVAGTPIPVGQSSCTNAGTGHWAPGATLNYGQSNPNSLNICPVGTYSAIETGSSANDCLSCSGATYNNTPGAAACKACPTGYTYNTTAGKDEITDCQIHCDAGTYAGSLVPDGYTELEYIQTTGTQYIDTGVAMNTLINPTMSLTMQYDSTTSGQQNGTNTNGLQVKVGIAASTSNFQCQADGDGTDVIFGPADTNQHTFVLNTANATCSMDNNTLPITVGDLSTMSSTEYFQIGARNSGSKNSAKYYHFSMTSDGVLIRDMVPAKRDSDDAVGMYDLVNGVFYTNAGTGDIIAGRAIAGSGCRNVGTGYWAAASTLNYGTLGARTACPVGTYSPIETGASAAACLSCTGATYGDETAAAACKSCPVNYDYNTTSGKTAENQCQTHCDAGTYVSTVIPDAYTQLEYIESTGTQYINTGIAASSMVNPIMTLDMQYTQVENSKYNGTYYYGPTLTFVIGINSDGKFMIYSTRGEGVYGTFLNDKGAVFGAADTNRHTFVLDAQHSVASMDSTTLPLIVTNASTNGNMFVTIGAVKSGYGGYGDIGKAKYYRFNFINNGVEIRNMIPVRRNSDNVAGMYDTVNGKFYASDSEDAFIAGPATACVAAGYGHYSAAATVDYGSTNANTLGACPIGKYSDVLNGTSVAVCQSCTGATYADTTGMGHCNACPPGYDYNTTSGKTATNQCQIHCDAGTYLVNPGNLPSGYVQLPYIEGTGNQYIDTLVRLSSLTNPVMSLTLQYTQVLPNKQSGTNSGSVYFLAGINSDTKFACQAGASGTQTELGDPDTNIHTFVVNTANATCSLDGVSSPLTVGSLDSNGIIKFGNPDGTETSASHSIKAKLYNFNLISNGVEIMNLVPAQRTSDGAIGMYDTIGNKFYPNVGSGTFMAPQTGCTGVESGYYAAASTVNYGATYVDTHNACPTGYDYSAAGVAGAQTDCYAMCTVSDVPHATAATGGKYYGGNTTCEPLDSNSCDTNYRYVAASGNNLAQCLADLININWGDANGGVWATTQCEYGGTITTPTTAPTKRGHTFVGWRFVAPTPEQSPVDPGE